MNSAHDYCRNILKLSRYEAERQGVAIPTPLRVRHFFRKEYYIEAPGRTPVPVVGDCVYEAKAHYIQSLIEESKNAKA